MTAQPTSANDAAGALDDEVAFWDARLRSPQCTDGDRAGFAAWRDGDPARALAFNRFQDHLEALRAARSASPELRAFRDEAIGYGGARQRWRLAAAAAAVAIGTGALGFWGWSRIGPPPAAEGGATASLFETAVGERSSVRLSDGSSAVLDTRTRLEVAYRSGQRRIHLIEGQALFDVAHDPARPFIVTVANQHVTAVGTRFAVRLDPAQVAVTTLEGKIRVGPLVQSAGAPADIAEHSLVAGQQLVSSLDFTRVDIRDTSSTDAVSWADGRVVFEDTPLSLAVAELRRYSPTPIVVADDKTGRIRVSGMAKTSEPLTFVRALPEYFPVSLHSDGRRLVLSSAPRAARVP